MFLLIAGMVSAAMGISPTAQAATTLANVAVFKPTEGTEAYGYVTENGNDDYRFNFTHGDDTLNSYWQVNLGAEYTVEQVIIRCRDAWDPPPWDDWTYNIDRINGTTLQAYADDGLGAPGAPVGDPVVLSGYMNGSTWGDQVWTLSWDNGGNAWTGVQHFRLGDQGDLGEYTPQYMQFTEFQAMVNVETYPNFITGITATASDVWGGGTEAENMVNHSGMDDQGIGIGNPAALHVAVAGDALWHSNDAPAEDPVVDFDLGGQYDLSSMVIWNEHQLVSPSRCTKDCTIEYSTDGIEYTPLADANDLELGNYTLTEYDTVMETPPWPASDVIDLGAENVEGRYIRMTIHSAWGDDPLGGRTYVGLSEVRFYGEEIISEQIPGDATGDGNVNGLDAQRLAEHWGATTPGDGLTWWETGDFDGDQYVGPKDAAIMSANWGYTSESEAGAPVPEPSALIMLGSLLILGLLKRRAS
jgi:hypothetical protein